MFLKYHISIVGCQYNEWDGARLSFFMQNLGFSESKPSEANVIIILACSVRQTAVDRILGKIKNWQTSEDKPGNKNNEGQNNSTKANAEVEKCTHLKSDGVTKQYNNSPLILVTGCILEADEPKFAKRGVQFFESGDLKTLFQLLAKHLQNKFIEFKLDDFYKVLEQQNTQSQYIPIMIGCNNFCSYCAVPYTRGRERSRPQKDILEEAKELIADGHKEIILLGQNVNSYRVQNQESRIRKNTGKTDFTVLLEKLNELHGKFVISFVSNHPKDMSDDIIEAVSSLPKIKKSIHLPLQSGSDKILEAMNRPYSSKQYLDIVKKIKFANPDIEITTDAIVGFPGEGENQFQETVNMFRKVNYSVAYVNKYSPRAGTAAEKLGDPIPWKEKIRRWNILNDIANKK